MEMRVVRTARVGWRRVSRWQRLCRLRRIGGLLVIHDVGVVTTRAWMCEST